MKGKLRGKHVKDKVHGTGVWLVLGRSFAFMLRHWPRIIIHLGIVGFTTWYGLIGPVFMQFVFDYVLQDKPVVIEDLKTAPQRVIFTLTSQWHTAPWKTFLLSLLAIWLIYFFSQRLINLFTVYWQKDLYNRMRHRLRTKLQNHFLHLSLLFHGRQHIGDTIFRIQNDTGAINQLYNTAVVFPWRNVNLIVTRLFFLFILNWALTLIALSAIPIVFMLNYLLAMPIRKASRRRRELNSDLMSRIEGTFNAIKAVVAFGREPSESADYQNLSQDALNWELRHDVIKSVLRNSVQQTMFISRIVLIFCAILAIRSSFLGTTLSLGSWFLLVGWFNQINTPIITLTKMWGNLQHHLVGMDRVWTAYDLVPEVKDDPGAADIQPVKKKVEFRHVSCEYEPGRPVLKNINLTARVGAVTALVGSVGSGKSTLVSCIPRFLDPVEGEVLLDGVNIRTSTLRSLRAQIALALQENVLFSTTIKENILYGSGDGRKDLLNDAVRAACLNDFIDELPEGLDTHVGEHAARLSGGEKQRVAIARAFMRDASILILDEPTASLDAETEARLLHNLAQLSRNKIVFIIAHRLATVRQADQICFLRDGNLLEIGSHDELVKIPGGHYRSFYETQYHITDTTTDQ